MVEQQPNNEEIFSILSEAKQYHREMLVKLIQANASTESLEAMLSILQMLDAVGIRASRPMGEERVKDFEERLYLLEEVVGNTPKKATRYGHGIAARPIEHDY